MHGFDCNCRACAAALRESELGYEADEASETEFEYASGETEAFESGETEAFESGETEAFEFDSQMTPMGRRSARAMSGRWIRRGGKIVILGA